MANRLKDWRKDAQRDKRGLEIEHLVPAMLQYVKDNYEPFVQYSVGSGINYMMYRYANRPLAEK